MLKVFEKYAEYYDLIYQDKDYEQGCDFIDHVFANHSPKPVKTILDAGCGTGGHAIPLVKRGYKVTGFGASEVMLRRAKERAEGVSFHLMDIRNFSLEEKFDACICMFAVMNYLTENEEIQRALANVRRHLKLDGLFLFDFWNGLAVLRILPEARVKTVVGEGKKVVRFVHPELDAFHHLCKSHYHLIVAQGNTLIDELEETHILCYFFPQEIIHYLKEAGFEVLKICPFLDLKGKLDEKIWNAMAIAKAR
jgi:SAM-dependent methyltransferase